MDKESIAELIRRNQWSELRGMFGARPVPELAEIFGDLEKPYRSRVFRALPRSQAADVFAALDGELQHILLTELTDEETRQLLAELRPDDRTLLLEELPGQIVKRLLALLSTDDLQEARSLLGYPEESVGRLMTPDYVAIHSEWTIHRALQEIRLKGGRSETVDMIYVVDDKGRLLDDLELKQIVLTDPSQIISSIMDGSFATLSPRDDRERAVQVMQKHDVFVLPVVADDGSLVGVVTADDVLDVAEAEATEDIQKGGGVEPLRARYRDTGIVVLFARRIPWLVGLLFVNLGASSVIALYEDTLASALTLAFFIPLLMGSGGNTGSQAASLIVRALATGDIVGLHCFRSLWKELRVGLMLGATMGLGVGLVALIRDDGMIALIVGLTMSSVVLVSNLLGTLFPILLTRAGADPALASSPLVTSTVDATSLILYFSIASSVIGILGPPAGHG